MATDKATKTIYRIEDLGAWWGREHDGLPLPLGGTSNHFRVDVLRGVGAWDPYNVTEDADLGLRLSRLGYDTGVLDSLTYEEANTQLGNWMRQRARWLKGFLMTWLVHMRRPAALWRDLGPRGFAAVQAMLLCTLLQVILAPLHWWLLLSPPQEMVAQMMYLSGLLPLTSQSQ